MRKFTQEEVAEYFRRYGCELLSEYKNIKEKVKFRCKCGNVSYITFDNFKTYKHCSKCAQKLRSESLKLDIGEVKKYFLDNNCIPLFDEYNGVHSPLLYVCECGNISTITFADFKRGKRCWQCGRKKIASAHRFSYDYVKVIFEMNNCILLTKEYKNMHQPLKYICECGNESVITLDKFILGQRCQQCGRKKIAETKKGKPRYDMRGVNNPNYNPNLTEEERIIKRGYLEYIEWRKRVFERDNYTCVYCEQRGNGNLNAHHLDGYNWCIEKRLDIDNGVTLCEGCHKEFHTLFGWKNNTKEQFQMFLNIKSVETECL